MSENEHLEQIGHIKKMMEENSKFLSLSGLSGVFAGMIALVGAFFAYGIMQNYKIDPFANQMYERISVKDLTAMTMELSILAIVVLLLALFGGLLFTFLKTKKSGTKLWNSSSRRLLINLFIPLFTGGVVCFAFIFHGNSVYVAPATLIFYGLALLNASKYTYRDIRYLAICQMLLGLLAMFFLGYGFMFWIVGFGFLHIFYGVIMYVKYDRK